MYYVRTKDGIYRSKRKPLEKDCLVLGIKPNGEVGIVRKDIIKKATTIEELVQDDDLALFFELKVYCDDSYYDYTIENVLMSIKDAKTIAYDGKYSGHFNIKDIKELYIKNDQGNYIKVAQKATKEGKLELL